MKKTPLYVMVSILILADIVVIGYNVVLNKNFLDASITTCLSLFVAIGFSFFIAQRNTDLRKQKEIFIQLLESLKDSIDNDKCYKLDGVSKEEILMRKRDINNKIDFITKYSEKFSVKEEIAFLHEKYNEYDTIIGDHINGDEETLKKLHNELRRPLSLMSQKIFEIMINLYN